jgi:hypothetical protein
MMIPDDIVRVMAAAMAAAPTEAYLAKVLQKYTEGRA